MKATDLWSDLKAQVSTFEPIVVVTFLAASISGFIFLSLTSEMLEGETRALDETILKALRSPQNLGTPIGPDWLTKGLTDITSLWPAAASGRSS